MLDRLEKFRSPKSWRDFAPAALILAFVVVGCMDFRSAQTDAKIIKESQQSGAAERDSTVLPLAHPLGCPEEAEDGRRLQATVSVMGEKRPRCYYGEK